jgi:hypothetical protein
LCVVCVVWEGCCLVWDGMDVWRWQMADAKSFHFRGVCWRGRCFSGLLFDVHLFLPVFPGFPAFGSKTGGVRERGRLSATCHLPLCLSASLSLSVPLSLSCCSKTTGTSSIEGRETEKQPTKPLAGRLPNISNFCSFFSVSFYSCSNRLYTHLWISLQRDRRR